MAEAGRKSRKAKDEDPFRVILCLGSPFPMESEGWSISRWAPFLMDLEKINMLLPVWARKTDFEDFSGFVELGKELVSFGAKKALAVARKEAEAESGKISGDVSWMELSRHRLALCVQQFSFEAGVPQAEVEKIQAAYAKEFFAAIRSQCAKKPGAFGRWKSAPEGFVFRHTLKPMGFVQEAGALEWAEEARAVFEAEKLEREMSKKKCGALPAGDSRRRAL